jgi:enolase
MPLISALKGRIIFDSRGNKTIEIEVTTDKRFIGRACAPSGASIGRHESQSFRDNNPAKSLEVLDKNMEKFIGIDAQDPRAIFEVLKSIDKTDTYSSIGGSVAYAVSIAAVDSAAKAIDIPLYKLLLPRGTYRFPFPLGNILGGGSHAGPGTPDIQEILACPIGAKTIMDALEMNVKLHKEMRKIIEYIDKNFTYGRGDEGGWAPQINNDQALELAEKAIKNCGFTIGKDMSLGVDFASSSLWDEEKKGYNYSRQGVFRNINEQIEFVNDMIKRYKLLYVEDPVNEEDFTGMAEITKDNPKCLVTGDDMLVTNASRVKEAVKHRACNGAILKVNQAGSLFQAMQFADECAKNNLKIITSHRSGESVDAHIAHIAIATNSKMLKSGVVGGERISKLNELLRISEHDLIEGMAELSFS